MSIFPTSIDIGRQRTESAVAENYEYLINQKRWYIIKLESRLKCINDIIYTQGAPLGSPEYFKIRRLTALNLVDVNEVEEEQSIFDNTPIQLEMDI